MSLNRFEDLKRFIHISLPDNVNDVKEDDESYDESPILNTS
jgi:hypothetical protein